MHPLHDIAGQPALGTASLANTVVVVAVTTTIALVVLATGACVVVWMALRGSRPQDRAAVLRALAVVLGALATLVGRKRR